MVHLACTVGHRICFAICECMLRKFLVSYERSMVKMVLEDGMLIFGVWYAYFC